ncbi:MAG: DUF1643 domain-containing protein [Rubricoccaceae bacterium]|nr:DUF1643 domain-containing protein [Rubricoccaceae bacterium]
MSPRRPTPGPLPSPDTDAPRRFGSAGDPAGGAEFSRCGRYRYLLTRTWDPARERVVFIGLNPSTADATRDDPTIRRIVGFARRWGAGGVDVLNLFAYRATDPRAMKAAADPVGPENDRYLAAYAGCAAVTVAAWGVHGAHRGRAEAVAAWLGDLRCLGTTRAGHPRHPLYLRRNTPLQRWTARAPRPEAPR